MFCTTPFGLVVVFTNETLRCDGSFVLFSLSLLGVFGLTEVLRAGAQGVRRITLDQIFCKLSRAVSLTQFEALHNVTRVKLSQPLSALRLWAVEHHCENIKVTQTLSSRTERN